MIPFLERDVNINPAVPAEPLGCGSLTGFGGPAPDEKWEKMKKVLFIREKDGTMEEKRWEEQL